MDLTVRRRVLRGAMAALFVAWLAPHAGFARKITFNTVDPVASLGDGGRRLVLTGPISNTQVEWVDLRVTVTQRTTGAIAEGRVRFAGTTVVQQWDWEAAAQGQERFEPGAATAVAVAVSSRNGKATDAHPWLVNITIQE
jgi:hypothetical protein